MEKLLFCSSTACIKIKSEHDVLTGFEQIIHIITPDQYFCFLYSFTFFKSRLDKNS